MTGPTRLPFDLVRVRQAGEDDSAEWRLRPRLNAPVRPGAAFHWGRLFEAERSRSPPPGPPAEEADDVPVDAADAPAVGPAPAPPPPQQHQQRSLGMPGDRVPPRQEPVAAADPGPAGGPPGRAEPGRTGAHGTAAAASPLAAVARSVHQAALVQELTEAIVGLCDGEASQRLGPWDMCLPLDRHGLGQTRVMLRLSPGDLSLRFECDGEAVRNVLSRHADRLTRELEDRLHPPVNVQVELLLS
jgi:hypothetical protein